MSRLLFYVGNQEGYESCICTEDTLIITTLRVAQKLKFDQATTQRVIATLIEGDFAAGLSIREPELTVHCSYSSTIVEEAINRLRAEKK